MTLRWNWGLGIAIIYALFAAGTLGVAVYAMRQRVDLVSQDYYAQSLKQDQRTAAIENVAALGSAFAIDVSRDGRLVTIVWPAGSVTPGRGTVTLYRPSDAVADRMLPVAPDARSRQRVSLADLAAGRWIIEVIWTSGGRDFYADAPVMAQ